MKSFVDYVGEKAGGGAKAGKHEVVQTPLAAAIKIGVKTMESYGRNLYIEIPNFEANYKEGQYRASLGHTKRRDMPVITSKDVKALQNMLKKGSIDMRDPYSDMTDPNDPFPEGLKGEDADAFFVRGLKINDGSKPDDKVNVKRTKITASKLVPIQQQIYFDKSIGPLSRDGAQVSAKFHTKTIFIVSSDLRIIDGHHRWFSALLLNPDVKIQVLMIDLPISKLLPLTRAFGDARGNKRNG